MPVAILNADSDFEKNLYYESWSSIFNIKLRRFIFFADAISQSESTPVSSIYIWSENLVAESEAKD